MENCFVEKYKGVINNDNLEKLGVLKVTAHTRSGASTLPISINDKHIIRILNTDEYVVNAWDNCTKIDDHTIKCTGTGNGGITMSAQCDVVMEIEGKYDIETFNIMNVSSIKGGIDSMWSTLEVLDLNVNTLSFNTSSFKKFSNIKSIKLSTMFESFEGNLSELKDLTLLEQLFAAKNTNHISGDISVLGKLTNLSRLNFTGNTNISGTIESFVAAQRTNGRTTESTGIVFGWGLANVTFNEATSAKGHDCTLIWTADTITYDGVTISA